MRLRTRLISETEEEKFLDAEQGTAEPATLSAYASNNHSSTWAGDNSIIWQRVQPMLSLVTSRNFFRLYMYRSSRPCNHFYTAPISRLTHLRHKETISAFLHRYRQSQTPFQSLPFIFKMQEMPNPRGGEGGGSDPTKSSLSSRVRWRVDSGGAAGSHQRQP